MTGNQLRELRTRVARISPKELSAAAAKQEGLLLGNEAARSRNLGTAYWGCRGPDELLALRALVSALGRGGCPILAPSAKKIPRSEAPGAVWVTAYCSKSALALLRRAASKVEGIDLRPLGGGFVLIVSQIQGLTHALAVELDLVGLRAGSASTGTGPVPSRSFPVDRYSVLLQGNIPGPGPYLASVGVVGPELDSLQIAFVKPGLPLPPSTSGQLAPTIPAFAHVLYGNVYAAPEQFPWYVDLLRNDPRVSAYVSTQNPSSNSLTGQGP
jgi:hypothetical protein